MSPSAERPTLKQPLPPLIAGEQVRAPRTIEVRDKYTGNVAAEVGVADAAMVDRAIAAAVRAAPEMRRLPTHRRRAALDHIVRELAARHEEFARWLVVECGKTIAEARAETTRAVETFRFAADECGRSTGELMPLDTVPRLEGYQAIWKRFPVGPCSFITPFNFPLNLAAHKIAPAIAVGCPFVLKPDPRTPVTSFLVGEILAGAGLPSGAFNIVPTIDEEALRLFSEDDRFALLSFTGSSRVGWKLKAAAGRKKVVLELGGNAACIVDESANLDRAARRILAGALNNAGQSCISVQRVYAHAKVYDELQQRLVAGIAQVRTGDPMLDTTTLGPMISEPEAQRAELWIREAVASGAREVCRGERRGALLTPSMLTQVHLTERVVSQELFAPAFVLERVESMEEGVTLSNNSTYGLQTGLFTNDLRAAWAAFERLEVGGVVVNDVPTTRSDAMPYGGVKHSGLGREGIRFAMEDMTEFRVMVQYLGGD